MRRCTFLTFTCLTLLLLWSACGGSSSPSRTPGTANGPGSLISTATDGSLVEIHLSDGSRTTFMQPEPGGYLLFPSVSPDGARIAYVSQGAPGAPGTVVDAGFDLWTAARDGSGPRAIFHHTSPNQQVTVPQWLDGRRLLAIVQERSEDGIIFVLERFDAETGDRQRVLTDVLTFGVSSDGSRIAFTRLEAAGLTLNTAAADGASSHVLLSPGDRLSPFSWPRYAPDGRKLAFTAAESPSVAAQRLVSFGPPVAPAADGAPQDVWAVDSDGGTPSRVAELQEDNPAITWSGDGRHIYANGTKGLFDIDVATGAVRRIGDGTFHAQIVWAP